MYTQTQTATYTVVDIQKTFGNFEADLRMIARRTGKLTQDKVEQYCHDVLVMAEGRYLSRVDITLLDTYGTVLQVAEYTINADGDATTNDRPGGNNDWQDITGSQLTVIMHHNANWSAADSVKRQTVYDKQKLSWNATTIDTSYSHLQREAAQSYASRGYGLNKVNRK
jgi:hypothetical protein